MDWNRYKQLCERPDHFSRWALQVTCSYLPETGLRSEISGHLAAPPLPKPADHKGGSETDYFALDLSAAAAGAVALALREVADGASGKEQRRLGHLSVVWEEYALFLQSD